MQPNYPFKGVDDVNTEYMIPNSPTTFQVDKYSKTDMNIKTSLSSRQHGGQ